jgi:transposase
MCKETMADLLSELSDLEERIAVTEKRLKHFSGTSGTVARLYTVPGIGLITATALVAALPDASAFTNGRQFAAWLGLVPKHSGTGGADKNRMGHWQDSHSFLRHKFLCLEVEEVRQMHLMTTIQ